MKEPFLGWHGTDNLTHVFAPNSEEVGARSRKFPSWNTVDFACVDSDPSKFFLKLITSAESILGKYRETLVKECEIAPGIGAFIEFSWSDTYELDVCKLQAIVVPSGDLSELLTTQVPASFYYRFEFSVKQRGSLFDHPFPHAHTFFDGAPRFPLPDRGRLFPLFHWLEFLMLNHHYSLWERWAISQCRFSIRPGLCTAERSPEDFLLAFPTKEEWEEIAEPERAAFVTALKITLREAADAKASGFPEIPAEFLSLNYWSA